MKLHTSQNSNRCCVVSLMSAGILPLHSVSAMHPCPAVWSWSRESTPRLRPSSTGLWGWDFLIRCSWGPPCHPRLLSDWLGPAVSLVAGGPRQLWKEGKEHESWEGEALWMCSCTVEEKERTLHRSAHKRAENGENLTNGVLQFKHVKKCNGCGCRIKSSFKNWK